MNLPMIRRRDVYFIPPTDPQRERGDRRHVIARDFRGDAESGEMVSAIYCSTRDWWTTLEPPPVFDFVDTRLAPHASGPFRDPTFVYYSALTSVDVEELRNFCGQVGLSEDRVRRKLVDALGIGTGSGIGEMAARGSRRGFVVHLCEEPAELSGTPYGIVLTQPAHSLAEIGFQIILPITDGEDVELYPDDLLLDREHDPWIENLDPPLRSAYLEPANLFFVVNPSQIARWYPIAMTDDFMAEIDDRLRRAVDLG